MYHEPPVSLASNVGQDPIHKGPTVALAGLGGCRDQREHYSTRVSLVLFEKCESFKHAVILEDIVSSALPQVHVKVVAVIL